MLGSPTAPGRPGARAGAPVRVAFHSKHSVGVPRLVFSRLNTQPMRTPVNASPIPSRTSAHDSGTVWFARPSLAETCTLYSLPVSRRTLCHGNGVRTREDTYFGGRSFMRETLLGQGLRDGSSVRRARIRLVKIAA